MELLTFLERQQVQNWLLQLSHEFVKVVKHNISAVSISSIYYFAKLLQYESFIDRATVTHEWSIDCTTVTFSNLSIILP